MADLTSLIDSIGGFGAGYHGQGDDYWANKNSARKEAWATDVRGAITDLENGSADRAITRMTSRLRHLNRLPDADPSTTEFTLELLKQGKTAEALNLLKGIDQQFVNEGIIGSRAGTPMAASMRDSRGGVMTQGADGNIDYQQVTDAAGNPVPGSGNAQFGTSYPMKDEDGNMYTVTVLKDPQNRTTQNVIKPIGGSPEQPVGQLQMVNTMGLTAEENIGQRSAESQAARTGALTSDMANDMYTRAMGIDEQLRLLDEAERALREGANTGPVYDRLPTLTSASATLDDIQRRMGLNVLQNTTFGALSEKELEFALKAAIPTNLPPAELAQWISDVRSAQEKLKLYLQDAAVFLMQPGNNVADWHNLTKSRINFREMSDQDLLNSL